MSSRLATKYLSRANRNWSSRSRLTSQRTKSRILQPLYVQAVSMVSSSATRQFGAHQALQIVRFCAIITFYSALTSRHVGRTANQYEVAGLSGPPLKPYSLATLKSLRALLPPWIPIFGCGGIASGADALEYARAGATAVQLYTSFGFEGVGAPRRIKDELTEALRKEGTTWAAVVKKAVAEKSLRVASERPKESTVKQLIEEAEELKTLLDKLGERM